MSDPKTPASPAGWYPDQADPSLVRYWDGAQWTAHTQAAAGTGTRAVAGVTLAPAKKRRKWPWIVLGSVGAFLLLIIIIGSLSSPTKVAEGFQAGASPSVADEPADDPTPEPVDTRVMLPDLTNMTITQAKAALAAVGITLETPAGATEDWIVTGQSAPGGEKIEPGDPFTVTVVAPAPVYSLAQQQAIAKAKSYLDFQAFSRKGLIEQLEYEGFSPEDSTFGADNAGADWNKQAGLKAQSYLKFQAFSRQGLYDQLEYEGFTPDQINAGLAAVGY